MLREEDLLAIITEQHETIQRLENRISELEEQLHKDSHNSSKPPSSVKQNPLPEKQVNRRGKPKKGKIRALIDRLIQYKGEVCRFADNPLVPFSNNQAECDLRMVKMKNKVIGCFRSVAGATDFLTLKSFTSTAAKVGQTAFSALLDLFQGDFACGTE